MTEQVRMTEEDFKKALDQVVLGAINEIGAAPVLGALAIVTRFTQVVYDTSVVARLQTNTEQNAQKAAE